MLKRILMSACAVLLCASASPVVAHASNGQAEPTAKCAKGHVCTWRYAAFKGRFEQGGTDSRCWAAQGAYSVSNQTKHKVRFYSSEKGCSGKTFDLPAGHASENTPFKVHHHKVIK